MKGRDLFEELFNIKWIKSRNCKVLKLVEEYEKLDKKADIEAS